ncbi:hypothetical protein YM80_001123 [Salmonella enterica subsp. salamae]|nr:hypothetical protein [Salmonella enterica subsp. salamae]EED7439072.1 hypothetical protein [Salmonella enterica subsp. salamae]
MGFCFGRQLLAKKPASAGFFMVAACPSPGFSAYTPFPLDLSASLFFHIVYKFSYQ